MKKINFLFFLLSVTTAGFAQSYAEQKAIPYLFEHFTKGAVLMKSGAVESASLNYNTEDQSISFEKDGKIMTLTGIEDIDTVYLFNKKFVPAADQHFYEMIAPAQVAALYASYYGKLKPAMASPDQSGTTRKDAGEVSNNMSSIYVLRPFKGDFDVEITKTFYLIKKKQLFKARSERDFFKVYPHHEAEITTFVSTHKIKFNTEPDMVQLNDYCNSLQ